MEPPSQGGQCYHRGKVRRVREAALYMACTIRRGRCPHRPAGGHMGPPLQIPTDGADHRKHLIRHGLRPCYFPLKGKAEAVAAGLRRGPIIAPLVKGGWHRRKAVTGGIPSSEAFWVNGIPHPASPGAPFHKGARRTLCAPTRQRAGHPLIRPCGPPSPQGEGTGHPTQHCPPKILNSQFLIINS